MFGINFRHIQLERKNKIKEVSSVLAILKCANRLQKTFPQYCDVACPTCINNRERALGSAPDYATPSSSLLRGNSNPLHREFRVRQETQLLRLVRETQVKNRYCGAYSEPAYSHFHKYAYCLLGHVHWRGRARVCHRDHYLYITFQIFSSFRWKLVDALYKHNDQVNRQVFLLG